MKGKSIVGIERAQRIFRGIDNEMMEFSEATVADMLEEIAARVDEDDAWMLTEVAGALRGTDSHHSLRLVQRKPGQWKSPYHQNERHNRSMMMLHALASREKEGVQTEAAISEIAAFYGVKRATVFKEIASAEEFLRLGRSTLPDVPYFINPRPTIIDNS